MTKYLALIGLSLMACYSTPPQGWAELVATKWAQDAKLNYTGIVCHLVRHNYSDHDISLCSINAGTQIVNLWCYYEDNPYCLAETK